MESYFAIEREISNFYRETGELQKFEENQKVVQNVLKENNDIGHLYKSK